MESRSRMMAYRLLGYQGPPLPRATRSPRMRSTLYCKKNVNDKDMMPFELLASVAEGLLQQRDQERSSSEKQWSKTSVDSNERSRNKVAGDENGAEQALLELEKSIAPKSGDSGERHSCFLVTPKQEPDDQGSSDEKAVVNCLSYRKLSPAESRGKSNKEKAFLWTHPTALKDLSRENNGHNPGFLSQRQIGIEYGLSSMKQGLCDAEIGEGKGENEIDSNTVGRWNDGGRRCDDHGDDLILDAHSPPATSVISEEAPNAKPPPLVSSDSSGGAPFSAGNSPHNSFFNCHSTMLDACREDDVNSSECTTPTRLSKRTLKTYSKQRKGTAAKQKKELPPSTKKRMGSDIDTVANAERRSARPVKPAFREGYTYQSDARRALCKRRRVAAQTSTTLLDGHVSTASATGIESNGEEGEPMASVDKLCTENIAGASPSSPASVVECSKDSSKKPNEPKVKVGIKSFTVPELSIDIPESATIASLKRAVMEAAMNMFGDGLRVCVLHHGKKIANEGFTLEQLGIQQDGKLDSVGFMLEPNSIPASQTNNEDPLFVLSEAAASQPLPTRYGMGPFGGMNSVETTKSSGRVRGSKANSNAYAETHNSSDDKTHSQFAPCIKSVSETKNGAPCSQTGTNPGALILHPSVGGESAQGLALVPLNAKPREIGKRRIRRPFTVAEVEALVHAVEKLGTGRWRDVKLRAFEHAKHRTYVDLKDKWKTLVHTARIAPHQRRGEPVPQDLLDRVIRAHNYWTDQQAKQQAEVCL